MKQLLFFIIGITMTSLAVSQTTNPELVCSAGESFENANYHLDWSIGECVTATHNAGDYVLTQGFHQNSYIITTVKDLAKDINISVYPNPTSDILIIKGFDNRTLQYTITDNNGKILKQSKITRDKEQLDFSTYSNGVYFLALTQKNQIIKRFKIIKN